MGSYASRFVSVTDDLQTDKTEVFVWFWENPAHVMLEYADSRIARLEKENMELKARTAALERNFAEAEAHENEAHGRVMKLEQEYKDQYDALCSSRDILARSLAETKSYEDRELALLGTQLQKELAILEEIRKCSQSLVSEELSLELNSSQREHLARKLETETRIKDILERKKLREDLEAEAQSNMQASKLNLKVSEEASEMLKSRSALKLQPPSTGEAPNLEPQIPINDAEKTKLATRLASKAKYASRMMMTIMVLVVFKLRKHPNLHRLKAYLLAYMEFVPLSLRQAAFEYLKLHLPGGNFEHALKLKKCLPTQLFQKQAAGNKEKQDLVDAREQGMNSRSFYHEKVGCRPNIPDPLIDLRRQDADTQVREQGPQRSEPPQKPEPSEATKYWDQEGNSDLVLCLDSPRLMRTCNKQFKGD